MSAHVYAYRSWPLLALARSSRSEVPQPSNFQSSILANSSSPTSLLPFWSACLLFSASSQRRPLSSSLLLDNPSNSSSPILIRLSSPLKISLDYSLFALSFHLPEDASVSSSVHRVYHSTLMSLSEEDKIHQGVKRARSEMPPPWTGHPHTAPGEWAACALDMDWECVKRGDQIKTPLLQALSRMPAQREPAVRPRRFANDPDLSSRVSKRKKNVEALVIQTVGDIAPSPCVSCQNGHGPFPICVTVPPKYGQPACGGCHWDKQGFRCSFNADDYLNDVDLSSARPVALRRLWTPSSSTPVIFYCTSTRMGI